MTYQDIIRQLPGLAPAELQDLRTRATALLNLGGNGPNNNKETPKDDETFALSCIDDVLGAAGCPHFGVAHLRKSQSIASFRSDLPALMGYLRKAAPNRAAQRALLTTGLKLLYVDMGHRSIPATGRTMVGQVNRVPALLDLEFPGYARLGLLGEIFTENGGA